MNRTLSLILTLSLALTGCATRPGGIPAPDAVGLGAAVPAVLGAGAGALIGEATGGKKGAIIGAVAGTAVGAVAGNLGGKWYNEQIQEAHEEGARQARVEVMNDYWDSHAINGGNAPKQTPAQQEKRTTTMTYPPGVYDGVLYGPRQVEVPVPATPKS